MLKSVYDKYLTNFNEIECILSREILLEGATKYLIVWQMLDDCDNNHLFEQTEILPETNKVLRRIQNRIITCLRTFAHKLFCKGFILFTGFVDADDYIIVLFDAFSEQPIAFKYTPSASLPQRMFEIVLEIIMEIFLHYFFITLYKERCSGLRRKSRQNLRKSLLPQLRRKRMSMA